MSALVEIRNVSKVYERGKQKVEVLHHIDLDIAKGDFFRADRWARRAPARRRC